MITSTLRITGCMLLALVFAGLSCTDSDDTNTNASDGGPGGSDTSSGGDAECPVTVDLGTVCAAPASGMVNLSDPLNYEFHSTLNISSVPVQGNTNLLFDWSQLTQDFLGHPVNPLIDIDMVLLTLWALGPDDLMQMINDDAVMQSDMEAVIMGYGEDVRTSEYLLNFMLFENPVTEADIMPYMDVTHPDYSPEEFTHMLMAATGEVAGEGARMLQFFYLDPNSTDTTVYINNTSTTLDYTVDLRSLQRLGVPSGPAGVISVDWSYLTVNSMGLEFFPLQVTRAVIANYSSMNICQVEDNFLDLDLIADKWYEAAITEGTSANFADLAMADGTPFQGVDDNGVWILALFCGTCGNPAPWFITVLQPCG